MELLLPLGLIVFIVVTRTEGKKPPTHLNPECYHDESAFSRRFNRIVARGGEGQ